MSEAFQAPSNPEPAVDPIAEILGLEAGDTSAFGPRVEPEPAASEPVQESVPEPVPAAAPAPPPDPEVERLRQEIAALKAANPIQEYLNSDPGLASQVMATIDQHMNGAPAPQAAAPSPPEAPARPVDFSQELAYTDPTSSSWRYREAVDQHRSDMMDFQVSQAQTEATQLRERLASFENQQKMAAQDAQNYQFAVSQGASAEQAAQYVQFLNQPQVGPQDLFRLFQATQGALATPEGSTTLPTATPERASNPVVQATRRLSYPTSTTAAASPTNQQNTADQIFDRILSVRGAESAFT